MIKTMSPKLWLSLAVCLQENQWPALAASIHFLLLAKVSPILILSRPGHISGQYSHLFSDKVSRSGIAFLTVSTNVCIQRFIISKLVYSDNLHLLTSSENTNIFLDRPLQTMINILIAICRYIMLKYFINKYYSNFIFAVPHTGY